VYDAIRRKAAQQAAAGAYARYEQLQFVYRILKQKPVEQGGAFEKRDVLSSGADR
jgi:hypothetical protein